MKELENLIERSIVKNHSDMEKASHFFTVNVINVIKQIKNDSMINRYHFNPTPLLIKENIITSTKIHLKMSIHLNQHELILSFTSTNPDYNILKTIFINIDTPELNINFYQEILSSQISEAVEYIMSQRSIS